MNIRQIYDDLPYTAKEELGLPSNYMYLNLIQQTFVDSLADSIETEMCTIKDEMGDTIKEQIGEIVEEMERLIERIC